MESGLLAVDPGFHQRAARFGPVGLDVQLADDLADFPAFGCQLLGPLHPAVMQVLLTGLRAGEPIGAVDPRLQAKELVSVSALLERPAAMHGGR